IPMRAIGNSRVPIPPPEAAGAAWAGAMKKSSRVMADSVWKRHAADYATAATWPSRRLCKRPAGRQMGQAGRCRNAGSIERWRLAAPCQVERLAEGAESSRGDRVAHLTHQPLVVAQVVQGPEHRPEHLVA